MVACERLYPRCAARCLPGFCSLSEEPGDEWCIFDDDAIAGAAIEPDPVRAELLDRDDARGGVVTIEEVRGVASGRGGEGMRTLVHKESLLGHRRRAQPGALLD